jgi:hypothetical protein
MDILTTMMTVSDTGKAEIFAADTIKYQNKFWIVPTWLEEPNEGWKMPERIVCLENLPHQKGNFPGYHFVLTHPIPKEILYDHIPIELAHKYVVIMRPDIKVSIPKGIH